VSYEDFFQAYKEAAYWTQVHPDNDDEENARIEEVLPGYLEDEGAKDCRAFYDAHSSLFGSCLTKLSGDVQAGHDFWMTRNGHGVGFWETDDWQEAEGEILTQAAMAFGEVFI